MKLEEIEYGISGIYKIIFANNKIYIGLSNDIRRRMIEHFGRDLKSHPDLKISRAIKKYPVKDIEIIEFINENDREKMQERERYWIKYYNSYNDEIGYNMTLGGDGGSAGIYNSASKLTEEDLNKIYNLLLNSDYTYNQIADLTNSSYKIISDINNGKHYRNNNFNYPLRSERKERYGTKNKNSAFYEKEEQLINLIQDLKENLLSYDELKEKYNIQSTTLSRINQGKLYPQKDETYPLRLSDRGKANRRIFTDDEMNNIKKDLEDCTLSMTDMGKIYGCDRKIISDINSGQRQFNPNWTYPLRKKKMKTGPKT